MSFTDVLNGTNVKHTKPARVNEYARTDLPIAANRTQPAAANIMASTSNKIEQAKNDLYEKIDVCCAQYGLYGLQVISEAISDSLSQMINGMSRHTSAPNRPAYVPPTYAQPVDESASYEEAYHQPVNQTYSQSRMGGAAAFTNNFMDRIGDIFEACDKDVEQRAEAQIKARLLEQKQADMLAAQQQSSIKQHAEDNLAAHADDFELISEENLHNV